MLTSPDSRLQFVLGEMNYCCGSFVRNPPDIKDAAYEALSAYNLFYDDDELKTQVDENGNNMTEALYMCVKFLGLPNSIQRKREFITDHWLPVKKVLIDLGITWKTKPKMS